MTRANRRRYTSAEDALLRREYTFTRREAIAIRLGRTPSSVTNRAFRLGVMPQVRDAKKADVELAKLAERARNAAERAARKRRVHEQLLQGCPLDQWLAGKRYSRRSSTGRCTCACHRRRPEAA